MKRTIDITIPPEHKHEHFRDEFDKLEVAVNESPGVVQQLREVATEMEYGQTYRVTYEQIENVDEVFKVNSEQAKEIDRLLHLVNQYRQRDEKHNATVRRIKAAHEAHDDVRNGQFQRQRQEHQRDTDRWSLRIDELNETIAKVANKVSDLKAQIEAMP